MRRRIAVIVSLSAPFRTRSAAMEICFLLADPFVHDRVAIEDLRPDLQVCRPVALSCTSPALTTIGDLEFS